MDTSWDIPTFLLFLHRHTNSDIHWDIPTFSSPTFRDTFRYIQYISHRFAVATLGAIELRQGCKSPKLKDPQNNSQQKQNALPAFCWESLTLYWDLFFCTPFSNIAVQKQKAKLLIIVFYAFYFWGLGGGGGAVGLLYVGVCAPFR